MERIYDNQPCNGDGACSHCDQPARWSTWCGRGWRDLCDRHFGVSLRKSARLKRLRFVQPVTTVSAEVGK